MCAVEGKRGRRAENAPGPAPLGLSSGSCGGRVERYLAFGAACACPRGVLYSGCRTPVSTQHRPSTSRLRWAWLDGVGGRPKTRRAWSKTQRLRWARPAFHPGWPGLSARGRFVRAQARFGGAAPADSMGHAGRRSRERRWGTAFAGNLDPLAAGPVGDHPAFLVSALAPAPRSRAPRGADGAGSPTTAGERGEIVGPDSERTGDRGAESRASGRRR